MKSFHNIKNLLIMSFLAIWGILIYSQPIIADQFTHKYGFFSTGSGSGINSLNTMSVVSGLAISTEDIENESNRIYALTRYSLINATNNAPVIIIQSGFHLTDLNEDPVDNKGNSISEILNSNGTHAIIDINMEAKKGLAITDVSHLNGQWEYTIDNDNWFIIDTVSEEAALLLSADSTLTRIRFVPTPNHNGSDNGMLTFRAWDQSKGLENGSIGDTRNNGGIYAYSEDRGTIGITIINVNDPPTANAGESYTINENETAGLDASQSDDIDDGIASFLWEQTSGIRVELSDNTSATPSFTVPEVNANGAFLSFKLAVSDHENLTAIDTITIYINNVLKEFSITANAEAGGTITPFGQSIVIEGNNQVYSISPENTYQIADILVDNISKGPKKSFTFWDVQASHTILALFKEKPSITASADENGQIDPQGQIYVNEGDFQLFKITPNDGYKIDDVLVNGLSIGPKPSYYFENVTGKNTISATFRPARFSITVQNTENGTILPANLVWVTEGNNQTFTITPSEGYEIASVTIDGNSVGIINTYTFYKVDQNHTIAATFRKKPVINSQWTGNGKIDPAGDIAVKFASSQAFTIKPSEGYLVKDVQVDGNSMGKIQSYIFSNVQKDHQIMAVFGQPLMKATAGENGTIAPSGNISVPSGSDKTFTITPLKNYEIETVAVDGQSIGPVSKHTFWNIVEDHSIHVTFKALPTYQLTTETNIGGTIRSDQGESPLQIIKGGFAQFKIAPLAGYEIEDVLVDNVSQGVITQYLFKNVQTSHHIQAIFKKIITYTFTATATEGGQITPAGSIVLEEGSYQLFTIAPSEQYRLTNVVVDGASIGPVKSYAFTADKDHSIHAFFEKIIIRSIHGRVIGEDIQTNENPGLSNYWVEVRYNGEFLSSATTDNNGYYTLTGLSAKSRLIVSAWPPVGNPDYRRLFYNQQSDNETADLLSTLDADLTDINFVLPRNYKAGIQGRVHNGESPAKGIAHVTVDVFSENATFGKNTTTDEQGYYTIIGLKPEDDYRVWVWSETHNLEYYFALPDGLLPGDEPIFSVFSYDKATPVTPSDPLLQHIDIIYNPNQGDTIQGQVFGPDGNPAIDIKVNAWSVGLQQGNVSTTDQTGYYTITGLERVLSSEVEQKGYIVEIQPESFPYQAYDGVSDSKLATLIATGRKDIHFYLKEGITIFGKVYNIENIPVPDVSISAWSVSDPNGKRSQTLSDKTGAYTLSNLPVAEDYILGAFPTDYPVLYFNQRKTVEDAILLDLRYSDQNDLNFYLDKGYVIGGQVYISMSKAPEGIPVNIWSESTKTGATVLTDINGRYEITGLSETATDYIISIKSDQYPPAFFRDNGDTSSLNDTVYSWKMAQGISASLWNDAPDRNINLEPGISLVGLITYKDQPVSDVTIVAWGTETGSWGKGISTNETKLNYTISGLAPDTYEIQVSSDVYADVSTMLTLTSDHRILSFALKKPERSISGTLVGLEENTSIRLNAWSTSENFGKAIMIKGNNNVQTYTISALRAASDYRLEIVSEDYPYRVYNDKKDWESADLIDLSNHNQTQIDFSLERLEETALLKGNVTFPNDAQTGDKVWIQVKSATIDAIKETHVLFENARTVPYTIDGFLKANDYIAIARSDTFLNQYYNQVDDFDDATLINMADDTPDTDIDFILHRGRSISGTIIDETQSPVKNVTVEVWSDKTQSGSYAVTNEYGFYIITGLKQINDFIAWVKDPIRGIFYYAGPKSVRDVGSAHKINTIPKDQGEIDIAVSQTYTISGRIAGEDGNVLKGVWVDAKSSAFKKGGGAYSGDDGSYNISGLPYGNDYILTATPERPYIGQSKENIAAGSELVNFVLQSITGVQLSGSVYSSNGDPLKGVKIEIQSATDKDKYALVQSGKGGAYLIENLPEAKDYMMSIWPLENSSDAFYSEKNIDLSENTIKNITLKPALKIAGIVTDTNKYALRDIRITVYSQNTNYWKEIKTDKNGKYELKNVPEATDYIITAISENYIKGEKGNQSPGLNIDFVLEKSGTISGYVRDKSSGIGLADVSVEVFSESMKGGDGFGGVANTDDNGFFNILELKPVDQQGNTLNDYVVSVYSNNYPSQSRGGRSVGDTIEFLLSKSVSNEITGSVANVIGDTILIDLFDTANFLKTLQADESGAFTINGLSADKTYQLRFLSKNTGQEEWAGTDGTGAIKKKDAGIFKVGDSIHFTFSSSQKRNRYFSDYLQLGMSSTLGPVRNLRSTSHPYMTIRRLRATTETNGQLSNNPNATIQWEPPEDGTEVSGYFSTFDTDSSTSFNKFNTVAKPPVRTRKITSRNLEGDDVSYYFHVSPVDKEGRVGQTTSIAFRIDTVPPTNVSVIPPIYTNNRSVSLILGATGASEMYISNISYSEGGTWELRTNSKTWQLPEGSGTKKVYVRYRDRANNAADASATTVYEIPAVIYTIDSNFGDHGQVVPEGQIDVEEGRSQTFTIIPDETYTVDRVLIDGNAVNLNELSYTFDDVQENHSIQVQFKQITHRISLTVGENGSVSPQESVIDVPLNDSQKLTVTPNQGYGVEQVLVDGNAVNLIDNTYKFNDVVEDHTFIVTFEKIVTITSTAEEYGNIEPSGNISIPEGGFQSFQIIPDPGYEIESVFINESLTTISGNIYTFMDVQNDQSIRSTFKLTQFTITAIANANGTISPKGDVQVIGGKNQTFIFTPASGYELETVSIDDNPLEINDLQYIFESVTENHTIAVTFSRINTAPVAKNSSVYTDEDIKTTGFMEATDVDGDSLTYQLSIPGKMGHVHVKDSSTGEFIYTPNPNVFGTDSFSFKASDGKKSSDAGTVFIYIKAVNDPPVAYNQSIETAISSPVSITLKATDMDGDPLQFNIVKTPELGMLSGQSPYLVYMPFVEERSVDAFYFVASDTKANSYTATVSITIGGPDADIITDEDIPVTITLNSLEPNESYTITSLPQFGDINGKQNMVVYQPHKNVNGYDQFDYISNTMAIPETVKIYIKPVNDAPIISMPSSLTMLEDSSLSIDVEITDIEDDPLNITIGTPNSGQVTGEIPDLTYVPMQGFKGVDAFTIQAMDGYDLSEQTIYITVEPKNIAPEAYDKKYDVLEDHIMSANLQASDINNDKLYYILTTNPSKGKVTIEDPNTGVFTYQPNANVNGMDTFMFKAYDGNLESNVATITIDIQPVNDPPSAIDGSIYLFEDQYIAGTLQGSDIDGYPLTFEIDAQGNLGTASITNPSTGTFMFSPKKDQFGTDYFIFKVIDGENAAYTAVATIDVFITPVNDAPQAYGNEAITDENTPVSVELKVTDIDTDINDITCQLVQSPKNGDVNLTNNILKYTPDPDFWGQDNIIYRAYDGERYSNLATVKIWTGVNKADIFTLEDQPVAFSLPIPEDQPEGTITFAIITSPQNGRLSGQAPDLTYTPSLNFNGDDKLIYSINDSEPLTLKIYVKPVNDTPVIATPDIHYDLLEDMPLAVTLIANDVDGDSLEYQIYASPMHGVLLTTDHSNAYIYSPHSNFNGQDQWIYQVTDGAELAVGRIKLTIGAVNDPPTANNLNVSAIEEVPIRLTLTATDIDADELTYEILEQPFHGIVSISSSSNQYIYTPTVNYFGKDKFTFRVYDGKVYSEAADVIINVKNINDSPVAKSGTIDVEMGGMVYGRLIFSDPDNDILISSISKQPAKGMVVISNPASGDYIFFADANQTGADVFEFTVDDNKQTVKAEIQVTIKAPIVEYTELDMNISGDYINGDPYEFMLLLSDTGKIYREGVNNTSQFTIPVEKGHYRLVIVGKHYQPKEYSLNDSKIISITEDTQITANLIIDPSFDPLQPTVEVSHIYNENGFQLHVVRKNFSQFLMKIVRTDGTEESVDKTIYTRRSTRDGSTDAPYIYSWTTESTYTEKLNGPGETDTTYRITFKFYDSQTPQTLVDTAIVEYVQYGSSESKEAYRTTDEKHFEDNYGDIQYIANGESVFYPLLGTTIHIMIKDINGNDISADINIPPIPLDYLFIDEADNLKYDTTSDTYSIDINNSQIRHVTPTERLRVKISNYTFGKDSLGTGVSVQLMIEGTDIPVHYNPVLNSSGNRLNHLYHEIPPAITLPILVNSQSIAYSSFMSKVTDTVSVKVYEKGDATHEFHTESIGCVYLEADHILLVQTPHLSAIGLDIEKSSSPQTSVDPYSVESPGNCFISVAGNTSLLNWFFLLFVIQGLLVRMVRRNALKIKSPF